MCEKDIQTAKEYLGGVKHRRFKATVEFKLLQSSNKQQFDKFRKLHIHESKYIKSYQLPDIENSYSKFIKVVASSKMLSTIHQK